MSFLSESQIDAMGFGAVGKNVLISDRAAIYNAKNIHIGSNVRIDDFCVISAGTGGIEIGNYIHIAVYTSLIGAGRIRLSDYCNLSSRVSIYSSSDDFSGGSMTNPMVPERNKTLKVEEVYFGKHAIVGSGSVVLPGAFLDEGVAIGALSLVKGRCDAFGIYAGTPARKIKERSRDILKVEQAWEKERRE